MKFCKERQVWGIWRSRRFDRDFYLGACDVPRFMSPERHYVWKGERRGLRPRPDFYPTEYMAENPDAAALGVTAFWHYLAIGRDEHRPTRLVPEDRQTLDVSRFPVRKQFASVRPRRRFAVVAHVYHRELWPEMAERLRAATPLCDVFVSVVCTNKTRGDRLAEQVRSDLPAAHVVEIPNHGRDILSFVLLANLKVLDHYRAVCKVHTKRSPHLEDGHLWREHLQTAVLPCEEGIRELLEHFLADPAAGIVVAQGQRRGGREWWMANTYRTADMLRRGGIPFDPGALCFPSGSMYWVKPAVIKAIQALDLSVHDFDVEAAQSDGTTAHAFERAVGYLCRHAGLAIREVPELVKRHPELERNAGLDREETGDEHSAPGPDVHGCEATDENGENAPREVAGFELCIDECSHEGVIGWTWDAREPERRWWVRLWVDNVLVARAFADQDRQDILAAGVGNGCYGYRLPIPERFFDGESHVFQVEIEEAVDVIPAVRADARLPPKAEVGGVTSIEDGLIRGWVCGKIRADTPCCLDLVLDGSAVCCTAAQQGHRDLDKPETRDLSAKATFQLEIPHHLLDGREHLLELRLWGSNLCIFAQQVQLVPTAGRTTNQRPERERATPRTVRRPVP